MVLIFCVMNCDDAAGFHLDTLTTSKQYSKPSVKGSDILTRTDYVHKYPSTLQTSYNFAATETTSEICVGIVKLYPASIQKTNVSTPWISKC